MRLPEPSSSQGGPFATPPRGRDSLSSIQSPTSNAAGSLLTASAGVGFFRPNVDFNSIFRENNGPLGSAPITDQGAAEAPRSNESIERVEQSDADENAIEPVEEEDEAVEENDSIAVQPLAVVAEASPSVENGPIDAEALDRADGRGDQPDKDSTKELPADSAPETLATNQLAKSTDATTQGNSTTPEKLAASKNELSGNARVVQSAGNGTSESQGKAVATKSAPISGEDILLTDAESTNTQDSTPENLQVAEEGGLATATVGPASTAQLAAQSHRQVDQTAVAGSTPTGESDESSNRTNRSGRGRNAGNTAQKGRSGQPESSSRTSGNPESKNPESAASQTELNDPSLSGNVTESPAVTDNQVMPATPNPAEVPSFETGIVTGQAVGTTASDTGNRPVAVSGPSGDMTAIGPASSDNSGRNGDQLSSRNAENLSRTDIADRARLIHRISKAFTKMGVDGGQIRMKMHPETLGGVLLEMRVRGRNVEATVTADNEAARGLLQQQLSELRQRLESQGMTVQRLEVALRDESATGGSLLNDPRDGMSGGDRGSDGYGQSRHSSGSENGGKTRDFPANNATALLGKTAVIAKPHGPAAPGTLDLRL